LRKVYPAVLDFLYGNPGIPFHVKVQLLLQILFPELALNRRAAEKYTTAAAAAKTTFRLQFNRTMQMKFRESAIT
jgi:hypothetical protein